MPTRNVVLTDHQAEMIEELVASGRYQNASEVLREGLRLLDERDAAHRAKIQALREAARIGFAAIEDGKYSEFGTEEALRAHLGKIAKKAIGRRRQVVQR